MAILAWSERSHAASASRRSTRRHFKAAELPIQTGRDPDLYASASLSFAEADRLRTAMRRSAGGVSIITAGGGAERSGMTVTSAISLSLAPPTMLITVDRGASAWPVIANAGYFAVNVPSAEQVGAAERFAGRDGAKGAARYAGTDWFRLGSGTLGLAGALAVIDCRVDEIIERYSHAIVLGAVLSVHLGDDPNSKPLVHASGAFAQLAAALPA